jgi:hypothetical protein
MIQAFVLLVCMLAPQGVLPGRDASKGDFLLARGRAGAARVGMTIDDLYRAYGWRDMKLVDLFGEGMFTPAIEISMDGKKALVAEIAPRTGFVVNRIMVEDSRFKTADGIGIGSTLSDLRKLHAVQISSGEGGLPCAVVEQLGITFGLDGPAVQERPNVPGNAKITAILVWRGE